MLAWPGFALDISKTQIKFSFVQCTAYSAYILLPYSYPNVYRMSSIFIITYSIDGLMCLVLTSAAYIRYWLAVSDDLQLKVLVQER